jgi:hypothetical protein
MKTKWIFIIANFILIFILSEIYKTHIKKGFIINFIFILISLTLFWGLVYIIKKLLSESKGLS